MKRFKEAALFFLVSLLSCLAVFQDAMWGKSIAAPVDLAPALWEHYQHVDPNQGPIPKNHYIVDQLSYDLPLQYLMYHSWRGGEVPWWNPYSMGGRPLLADAHCNGTDPIRMVVYFTLPDFVLAYNWTLIAHGIGTGIGLFVLLRTFGVRPWLAGACALAGQWAGGYVLYVGHPWVRGSLLYYPWLWLTWRRALLSGRFSMVAPFLVAAIFYAGNLQSHAYLPVFAFAIGAGYAGLSHRKWWIFLRSTVPAAVLGALIAAPALIPQLELYLRNIRSFGNTFEWHWLEAGATLAGVHPWAAGTFRTVSLSGVTGGVSFHLAVGGAVIILALFGWSKRKTRPADGDAFATGGWLVLWFFVIVLTPLHSLLYLRAAGLGIIGLTVLAGWGGEVLLQSRQREPRWSRATWALAALIAIATTVLAYGVYPRFQEKARELMLARAGSDGYGGASRELRNFQTNNFAREVSLQNPECILNVAGLVFLAAVFGGCPSRGAWRLGCAFAVSIVSLLMFAERFIVRSPVETWSRLLQGGPVQKPIIARLAASGARMKDEAPQDYLRVFPMEISALHRLHVAHGYAALQPLHASAAFEPADARGENSDEILSKGDARFFWKSGSKRDVHIAEENLNRVRISYPAGVDDVLVRTDTWYPGWTANKKPILPAGEYGIFGEIPVPAGQTETICEYRPSRYRLGLISALTGAIAAALLKWFSNRRTAPLS